MATSRCVLFVHGVGEQRKSDTLLYIGSPLVNWVIAWARQFYNRSAVQVGPVQLSFAPYELGSAEQLPLAVISLPEQTWYLAEAWWAGSTQHPNLQTMLYWSFVHLFDILAQMVRNVALRWQRLLHPTDRASSSQPARIWQLIDLLNCGLLAVIYALGILVGYALLLPLMLLAQIPIEAVQNFVVLKLLKPVLTAGAGEFRMYLDDELQAANVRQRVASAARTLLERSGCDELIVVAHSEGCVVSLGMLTDPAFADVARRTRKLLTFGAGLNKSWLLKPGLDRLFTPLVGDTLWTDFWASYDPVPAGPLDPSRARKPDGSPMSMADVYHPSGDALDQVGDAKTPIDEQVTNGMNVVTDHGGYFSNDEQVLVRLAAEISSPRHVDSSFWPDQSVLLQGIRRRRERVSLLALLRDIAFLAWAVGAVVPWLAGSLRGVDPWQALGSVPAASIGPAAWLISLVILARNDLPAAFAPVSATAGLVLELPIGIGLAAVVGVVAWAAYTLLAVLWCQPRDTEARANFLQACVQSSLERLKATPVAGSPTGLNV